VRSRWPGTRGDPVSTAALALLAGVVAVAAFVQGSSGMGFALVTAPVMGIVAPGLLPVVVLALMVPLNLYVAFRERGAIDWRGAGWISTGRLFGTAGGFAVLVAIPTSRLDLLIGASTVLAVLASLVVPSFTPGHPAQVIAGAVTGVTETATGVGGPPLVLLHQHRPAPVLRSTVALCFLVGEVISLLVLLATGTVDADQVRATAVLLPAVGLGALASHLVHHRVGGPRLRTGVLLFALTSGIALLVKG
jgi:uncharacterized membrane protein YfcA